jgi:hypothetical protein
LICLPTSFCLFGLIVKSAHAGHRKVELNPTMNLLSDPLKIQCSYSLKS